MEWPIEIHVHNLLERIERLEKNIMSGLTDLQAALAANTTATVALKAAVAAIPSSSVNDMALTAAVATLNGNTAEVTAATATAAALAPTPVVPPAA